MPSGRAACPLLPRAQRLVRHADAATQSYGREGGRNERGPFLTDGADAVHREHKHAIFRPSSTQNFRDSCYSNGSSELRCTEVEGGRQSRHSVKNENAAEVYALESSPSAAQPLVQGGLPLSVPVRNTSGTGPSRPDAPPVVNVRLMGPAAAVEAIADRLRDALAVAEESGDYPRRRDLGVRRYLTVVLPAEGLSR
jgi:hypothetical protein